MQDILHLTNPTHDDSPFICLAKKQLFAENVLAHSEKKQILDEIYIEKRKKYFIKVNKVLQCVIVQVVEVLPLVNIVLSYIGGEPEEIKCM